MVDSVRNLCSRLCCCRPVTEPEHQNPGDGGRTDGIVGGGEEIVHRTLAVNGINMHVAEKGTAPWFSSSTASRSSGTAWRHQIHGLASCGYRAVAPDFRDVPSDSASCTIFHLVALIDALSQDQVFVVGHGWWAQVAWSPCMFRPEKVKALVSLSVAFTPRNSAVKLVESFRSLFGDDSTFADSSSILTYDDRGLNYQLRF